jgi:lysozyme
MNVEALIRRHEGCRYESYLDTRGVLTAGVGHCGPDVVPGMTCTEEQVDAWLRRDVQTATIDAALALGAGSWQGLDEVRRAALTSAAFNLGRARLMEFRQMLDAIRRKQWDRAAREALASRWAEQTGVRAREIAGMLETGLWPPIDEAREG